MDWRAAVKRLGWKRTQAAFAKIKTQSEQTKSGMTEAVMPEVHG
jgi:hypothetical protein